MRAGLLCASCIAAILCLGSFCCAQNQDKDYSSPHKTSANAPPPEDRIDINHATLDELSKVPGMTQSWAGRIIRYRPYRTKQDLLDQGIVSDSVYDRIKDYIIAHHDHR